MVVTGRIAASWLSWACYVLPEDFLDTTTVCVVLAANIPPKRSFYHIICPTVEMSYLLWPYFSKPIGYSLWMSHRWKCSRSGCMGLWVTWSSERCLCQWQAEWIRWYLKGLFQPKPLYDIIILWYVCKDKEKTHQCVISCDWSVLLLIACLQNWL